MDTKLMERIFSAQKDQESEILEQLKADIKKAKEEGLVDAEQYVIVNDAGGLDIYDKVNKEVTHIDDKDGNYNISTSSLKTYPKEGEIVKWTSTTDGKELTGKLVKIAGDTATVTIKGQTKDVPLVDIVKVDVKDLAKDAERSDDMHEDSPDMDMDMNMDNPMEESMPTDEPKPMDDMDKPKDEPTEEFSNEVSEKFIRVKSNDELDVDEIYFKLGETDFRFNPETLQLASMDEDGGVLTIKSDISVKRFFELASKFANESELKEKATNELLTNKIQNAETDIKKGIEPRKVKQGNELKSAISKLKTQDKKVTFSNTAKVYIAKRKLETLK